MRRVLVSLILGASLVVIGAGLAFGVVNQTLPDAACNQGTASAPDPNGTLYVPMDMTIGVADGCMTMNGHRR